MLHIAAAMPSGVAGDIRQQYERNTNNEVPGAPALEYVRVWLNRGSTVREAVGQVINLPLPSEPSRAMHCNEWS